MLDLIEVDAKPKLNKLKVFITAIIAILMISGFITLGIVLAKKSNEPKQENNESIVEEQMEGQIVEQEVIVEEQVSPKIPVLTQEGKDKINNIYHLEGKTAYLTFDDGPSKTVTPLILDVLKENNIKATFFTLGSRVELYPEIVKREYEEGHYIANHGYSHVYANVYSTPEAVLNEYIQTENAIKSALEMPEYNSYLFRFPGGSVGGKYKEIKKQAIQILNENNIAYVDWNALTNDSVGSPTKEEMMNQLINTVSGKNNVVILMHDAGDKILTYELLPEIIKFLQEQGYTFDNFYNIMK